MGSESEQSPELTPPASAATALVRGLSVVLLVANVLGIFFAGMFPFDFSIPPSFAMIRQFYDERFDWRWFQYDPGFIDRGQNILFFIPFGFALAAVLHMHRANRLVQLLICFVASLLLTGVIEFSQIFVSFRDPSLMDVWCNTLGGLVGAVIFIAVGMPLMLLAAQLLLHLRPLAKPQVLAAVLVVYSLIQLSAPLLIRNPGNLSSWDAQMPLIVGNELTVDRPWRGTVGQIVLADRAASADEAARLFLGDLPYDIFGSSLVANYQIVGSGPYRDFTDQLPPLEWVGSSPEDDLMETPEVRPNRWLKTEQPVSAASQRIAATSQFTLAFTVRAEDLGQTGPARLVSISRDTSSRNLQLGQDFKDVVVRVRTGMRSTPDLYLRNTLSDQKLHHILVTHINAQITAYVDGVDTGRVDITPEAKVIWRLYPRAFRMYIDRYGYRSYAAVYRLLVFIPFAVLLGAALVMSRLSSHSKRLVGVGATLLMVMGIETILGFQSAGGFQIRNMLISLLVGLGTLGIMAWRRTQLKGS